MSDQKYLVYTAGWPSKHRGTSDGVKETCYTFWASSYHDAKRQAKEHGLFGEEPLKITRPYDGSSQKF